MMIKVKFVLLRNLVSRCEEWSASRLGHFNPREKDPGAIWIRGWVKGPKPIKYR